VLVSLLRRYLRPYRRPIILIMLFQLVSTIASLYLPGLNAQIIDQGVVTGDTGYILSTGAVMLGVTAVQIVCSVAAVYFGARTAMALGRDLRESVFVTVESFAAQEVGRFGAPSLITRSTNDIQQVQMLVLLTFTMMITAPIMAFGGIIMALRQDVQLSSLLVVIVPILLVCVAAIISQMRPLFRSMQLKIDLINAILREQIGGVRVIRAFVKDTHEQERFDGASVDLRDVSVSVGRLMSLMFPMVMLIMNVSSVAVMWLGGHRIANGDMQIGTLTAFLSYLMQILISVMMATFMFVLLPRAEVSAERRSATRAPRRRCCTGPACWPGRGRRPPSWGRPAAARRRCSTSSRDWWTSPVGWSWSTTWTSASSTRPTCGPPSAWFRSGRTCSGARWRRTFATARPTPATKSSGPPSRSPRPASSSRRCRRV